MNIIKWLSKLNPFSVTKWVDEVKRLRAHHVFTETLKERTAIAPGATVGGTVNSTSILTSALNMGVIRRARAILFIGTIPGGGVINFSLQASATAAGTYAAITNLTTNPTLTTVLAGISALEIRADQMPAGKPFLKAIVTETGGQTVPVDIILLGDESAYKPGSQFSTGTALINDVVSAT